MNIVMRLCPRVLMIAVLVSGNLVLADDLDTRVATVLKATPLIDGHNDLPWQYHRRVNNHLSQLDLASDLTQIERPTDTDLPRLRRGRVGGLFWSVYIPIEGYGGKPSAVQAVMDQIDLVKRLINHHEDDLELALDASSIRRIHKAGKIASLIGMEGGHSINNSLASLRQLYELGARYMTLTHSKGLLWADSATDTPRHGGLTGFGELVVLEMNRLGMMVDLSHVSVETMRDALRVSRAPVIFSHSSAYAVTQHARNVPDDILALVGKKRGVVMVNYLTSYVSEPMRLYRVALERHQAMLNRDHEPDAAGELMAQWSALHPAPEVTLFDVADHIDHIKAVAGIEAIGLGADFDGMPPGPVGLEDVSTYPALLKELLIRGYSDQDIANIAGENLLRVMTDVEAVAARLRTLETPRDDLLHEIDRMHSAQKTQ
ncbi:dipeptidase [Pseudomonadales bacterium]|jgi:membrane dipeptidase|nr:dipeptidase [Pseudomonadales bacterium]MDC0374823.1 dipeptidase [Pseudomonadales bacterium]MDC1238383.1 dipeptidase [Pseudomonadales bacterium]MDC1298514.1 dipeptidase [Pseudomonadales bacterium]